MTGHRLSLIMFSLIVFVCHIHGQCDHQDDYTALRALYLDTGGDHWTDSSGWPDNATFAMNTSPPLTTDMNSWYGITCSDGRVVDINLSDNGLQGTIPNEIGGVTELTNLSLRLNSLTGAIPESIGRLKQLIGLFLYDNLLTGEIPDTLGTLDDLQFFRLNNNELTGEIPFQLGSLMKLKTLYLSDNLLTGAIPVSLTQLEHLQDLNLDRNQLTGSIPTGFGSLSELQYVFLYENNLSGCIPSDFDQLCSETIELWGNPLLPWQGSFTTFCSNTNTQAGAPCDDGISDNGPDFINADCSCGEACINMMNRWQGPIVGTWDDDPTHWSANRIPRACDDILIPSPYHIIIPQEIIGLGQTLDIESGAMLDVLGQLEIGN